MIFLFYNIRFYNRRPDSNTDSTDSSDTALMYTNCHAHGDSLPLYNALYSTEETHHVDPDPTQSSTTQLNRRGIDFKYDPKLTPGGHWKMRGHGTMFYWHRTLDRPGQPWHQYGISANQRYHEAKSPSHYFTCKMQLLPGHSEKQVKKFCKEAASSLKLHRGPTGGKCTSCDFKHTLGHRGGCSWGLYSVSGSHYRSMMKRHDEACSCGCFDVECYAIPVTKSCPDRPQHHAETSKTAMEQASKSPEDAFTGEWTFNHAIDPAYDATWTRTIKTNDEIWSQYGISKHHLTPIDGKPEFFFTCKSMPREENSEQAIRKACKFAAVVMRVHRRRDYDVCTCNFETLRTRQGRCTVSWRHLLTRWSARWVWKNMERHDRLCSCGCFDV